MNSSAVPWRSSQVATTHCHRYTKLTILNFAITVQRFEPPSMLCLCLTLLRNSTAMLTALTGLCSCTARIFQAMLLPNYRGRTMPRPCYSSRHDALAQPILHYFAGAMLTWSRLAIALRDEAGLCRGQAKHYLATPLLSSVLIRLAKAWPFDTKPCLRTAINT